jgi:carbohydrate-selective porin OprB
VNRFACTVVLILSSISAASAQWPSVLDRTFTAFDQRGISLSFQFYSDTLAGSRTTASAPAGTAFQFADLSAEIELGRWSSHLARTRVFTSFHANGRHSADFVGAEQSAAGLYGAPGIRAAELWVEERLTGSTRMRVGKIDANPDFGLVEIASGFMNAAAGYDPTFFVIPNYTDTRWGSELLLRKGHLRINLAVFIPNEGTGPLLMQEVGLDWQPTKWTGRVSVGFWQRTGRMASFAGVNESGANGTYAMGEQKFWRRERHNGKNEQSLSGFVQLGSAPSSFSAFTRHLGTGLVWNAPVAARDRDALGFEVQRGRLSDDPAAGFDQPYETVYEAYYRVQISKQLSVSPDFQYFIHPGGVSTNQNGFAAGARLVLSLTGKAE